jgi:hypothetical protein
VQLLVGAGSIVVACIRRKNVCALLDKPHTGHSLLEIMLASVNA